MTLATSVAPRIALVRYPKNPMANAVFISNFMKKRVQKTDMWVSMFPVALTHWNDGDADQTALATTLENRKMDRKPIALTCGDPAGVGPEVVAGWLGSVSETAGERPLVVIGPQAWLEQLPPATPKTGEPAVDHLPVGPAGYIAEPGQPSQETAAIALEALETAAAGCRAGHFAGVVTGPVSKFWMQKAGFAFPGQTEFFAARWGGEPSMAFAGERLRMVLATWHIPLRAVPDALTRETLTRAVERADYLGRALGSAAPRIGVCGLNPHAGEEGLLGSEERDVIDPLLDVLRQRFPGLSRALPGDTVFLRALRGEFDVTVALYHDQGLAPLKTLEFDTAVNITLGLPWIRTSPDHGTGYGIAGKGKALWSSFANAFRIATALADFRDD